MVGTASKKLNLEAVLVSIPNAKAAEIVMPDLEVPGISAKHWARPIINDWIGLIDSSCEFLLSNLVLKYKTTAKRIVA